MGIFLFSCFGTMTSPTPKSTSKGVRVFLIRGSQHTWTFPNGAKIPLGKRAVNRVVAVPLSVGAVVYTFASGSPSRSSARVSASVLFRSHHIHRFRIIREAALRTGMEQRCQLPFAPQNLWLSRLAAGYSACAAHGTLQSFLLPRDPALSGHRSG